MISFMLSPLFNCICLTHLCLRVFSYIYLSLFLCFFFLSCPFSRLLLLTAFFFLLSRVCLSLSLLLLFLFIFCSFYFFHLISFVLYLFLYSFYHKFIYDVTLICNLQSDLRYKKIGHFHPKTRRKARKGSRGIALLFNLGARWGWGVKLTPRPLYPCERDPLPMVQE